MSRWAVSAHPNMYMYDRYMDKCTHTGYTACVHVCLCISCSTLMARTRTVMHTMCQCPHLFQFFFFNPHMCQCKRALHLSLTLFLLASSKLGLYIINHLCRLCFCVVSLTQDQTRPQLEVILWTISILIQRYTVHGPITCMCYGEPVYCMAVVFTSTCML